MGRCVGVSHDVRVLLGNGDGTFGAPAIYADAKGGAAALPTSLAKGDVNNDGELDIVATSSSKYGFFVLLGNGNGTFQSGASIALPGRWARGIALADVDGDGKLGVVTGNSYGNSVSVLLGNGSGGFGSSVSYSPSPTAKLYHVAVGDLNGDGKLDIAAADNANGALCLFWGNGNGTFQVGPSLTASSSARFVVAADFNLDGIVDVAISASSSSIVHVFGGLGGGAFMTPARAEI